MVNEPKEEQKRLYELTSLAGIIGTIAGTFAIPIVIFLVLFVVSKF